MSTALQLSAPSAPDLWIRRQCTQSALNTFNLYTNNLCKFMTNCRVRIIQNTVLNYAGCAGSCIRKKHSSVDRLDFMLQIDPLQLRQGSPTTVKMWEIFLIFLEQNPEATVQRRKFPEKVNARATPTPTLTLSGAGSRNQKRVGKDQEGNLLIRNPFPPFQVPFSYHFRYCYPSGRGTVDVLGEIPQAFRDLWFDLWKVRKLLQDLNSSLDCVYIQHTIESWVVLNEPCKNKEQSGLHPLWSIKPMRTCNFFQKS